LQGVTDGVACRRPVGRRAGRAVLVALLAAVLVPAVAAAQAVTVVSGPPPWTNQTDAFFGFAGAPPAGIECRLAPLGWEACADGHTVSGLAEGRHVLEVRSSGGPGAPEDSWTWRVDLTAPSVPTVDEPGQLWQPRRVVPVSWRATDSLSGIGGFDVRYEVWKASSASSRTRRLLSDTKATGTGFAASSGRTYCFEAEAEDRAGNPSPSWSAPRCLAVPLDDSALTRAGGWLRRKGTDGYFHDGYIQTRTRGAHARRAVVARRLVLLASTCPSCGSVVVRWRGSVLKRIDLTSARFRRSVVVPVASFASARPGSVRVDVVSSGKLVRIDGLGVSAA
jgi:hypothetical protein